MKRFSLMVLVVLVMVANMAVAEKAPLSIRGEVTKISGKSVLLVEGKKDADTIYDKASVTIKNTTKILRVEGEQLKEAKLEDLKVGTMVEITFTGPVKESYPVQADAGKVVILPKVDKRK